MSSLKRTLMKKGMELIGDPRVAALMQDERIIKAFVQMLAVPGKVQSFTTEQVERLAKSLNLATEDEVNDLKRQIRHLEGEISRLSKDRRVEKDRR